MTKQNFESLIIDSISEQTCLTIISVSGSGKSGILREISKNQSNKIKFLYIDLAGVFKLDDLSLISQISIESLNFLVSSGKMTLNDQKKFSQRIQGSTNLQFTIYVLFEILAYLPTNTYLIFDHFEKIINYREQISISIFKYLRDMLNGKIQYLFCINDLNCLKKFHRNFIGSLADLICQKILYLPIKLDSYSAKEEKIKSLLEKGYSAKKIYEVSSGFKSYMKALNAIGTLDILYPFPEEINSVSERIINSLTFEQVELLSKLALSENISSNEPNMSILTKLGIINTKGEIFSPFLKEFIRARLSSSIGYQIDNLTNNESKIYNLLLKKRYEIVSKQEISEAIWGKHMYSKSSEWAIDQTLKRLRTKLKKINPEIEIETKRGRGVILR